MKYTLGKLSVVLLISAVLLAGCGKDNNGVNNNQTGLPDTTNDMSTSTSPKLGEEQAKAMKQEITIGDIESILIKDLEGNEVERFFGPEDKLLIKRAFNDSFIMDTAYIEMITGNTMTIYLEDGREVNIHSYGQEDYIVASIDGGPTYHLGCNLIGTILLEDE